MAECTEPRADTAFHRRKLDCLQATVPGAGGLFIDPQKETKGTPKEDQSGRGQVPDISLGYSLTLFFLFLQFLN